MDTFEELDDKGSYGKTLYPTTVNKQASLVHVRLKRTQDHEWIDEALQRTIQARNYYRRNRKKSKDWDRYTSLCQKVNKGWERPRPSIMLGLCEISQQPTSMPAQLNTFGRAVSRPVNLINWGGKTITCSAEIDNSFVKHFSSLQSSATRSPKYPNQSIHNHLQIREDVLSKLHVSSPDTQNATGPDKSRQGFFKWPLHPYTPA